MKEFIDCHCHIFNLADVPLYATIDGQLNVNVINKLKYNIGMVIGGTVDQIDNLVEERESFIRYFERDLKDTIVKFQDHLLDTINETNSEILITPLIMDFDCIEGIEPNSLGKSNLELQTERLVEAIEECNLKIKICPFVGYDLRKLILKQDSKTKEYLYDSYLSEKESDKRLEEFKILWNKYSLKDTEKKIKELKNGEILGIKLYPPIGFNPYPEDDTLKERYMKFYTWCKEEEIPITVHCQKGSYTAEHTKNEVNAFTDPKNWENLLKNEDLDDLRINFAHFGGDDGVEEMLDISIDKNSWTYTIIQLLKNYDNTFSDISAYDYGRKGKKDGTKLYDIKSYFDDYSKNLKKVFEYDEKGRFGNGKYKLEDKILWGSDVPMVISDKIYGGKYKNYYQKFEDVINMCDFSDKRKKEIIDKITSKNPKKFLKLK